MSLRSMLTLSAALALSACGSMPGLDDLAGPPGATYQSSKAPTAYAQCLTPRWQATRVVGGNATVDAVRGAGGGQRLSLVIGGSPARVVEIAPQGSGSTIRYWNRTRDFGSGTPEPVRAIEDCR